MAVPARRPPRPDPVAGSWPVDTGRAELVPDGDGRRGWTLVVNGVPSSHVDLDDPTRLDFEYVRWFGDDNLVFSTDFPHLDARYPESTNTFLGLPITDEDKRKILWDNCLGLYGNLPVAVR